MRGEAGSANTDDEAAVWASKLEKGLLTEAEENALDDWLAGNPHRLAALVRAQAEQRQFVQTTEGAEHRNRYLSRRRFLSMAVATGICGAGVSGGLLYLNGRRKRYATAVGEMGHVLLPDGSMAILNTATEIALAFTPTERNVRLLRGEALFDVELDALRFFVLEAGDLVLRTHGVKRPGTVREDQARLGALVDYGRDIALPLTQEPSRAGFEARGTTFSTRIRPGGRVEVAMLEGTIEVGMPAPRLRVDRPQVLTFRDRSLEVRPVDAKALERKLAWLQRGIVLGPGDSVADGVTELNRYNSLRIVVEGPIATRQLRGTFSVDRPLDFVGTLENLTGAKPQFGDRVVTIAE